jgi:hypothetical protein
MEIYIACGLTHVPRDVFDEHVAFIHKLAATFKGAGHEVMYALVNSDPQLAAKPVSERPRLCYGWDRRMVEHADLVIAELSFPSTGVGIEMQIAANKDIPIIICYRNYGSNKVQAVQYENPDRCRHDLQIGDGFITLMALGVPSVSKVIQYSDRNEAVSAIIAAIDLLDQSRA